MNASSSVSWLELGGSLVPLDTAPKVTKVTYLVTGQGQMNRSRGPSEFWQEQKGYMHGSDETGVKNVESSSLLRSSFVLQLVNASTRYFPKTQGGASPSVLCL